LDKLTKLEWKWILYDVGNSAFTLMVATVFPIYFNYLADMQGITSVDYLSYWGYAASIATIVVALIGPVLGTISDAKGYKKPIFAAFIGLGVFGCAAMGLSRQWLLFLVIYVIAKIGFNSSLIFYDSMLSDVTTTERMDRVSASGFAWGYIGSCVPFVLSLALILGKDYIGISMMQAMLIAFAIVAVWWLVCSIPLLRSYKQIHYVEKHPHVVKESFRRLGDTFVHVREEKQVFLFLIAFFFYIDGVYTIIDMATAYGSALGLDSTGLLLALLATQIVAFPCSILFGRLSEKMDTVKLIIVCIMAYFAISVFAIFMAQQWQFWVLAVMVGMFQGGIQALSRSYFTKIIPAEKSGEYFGIMDICGKGASFMGTMAMSVVSQLTGSVNAGVGIISVFFIIGIVFFLKSTREQNNVIPMEKEIVEISFGRAMEHDEH